MAEETPRELQRFLDGLQNEEHEAHWDFTVYSTYATSLAASDASKEEALDKSVCDRFRAYIESNLRFTVEKRYGKNIPLGIEFIRLPSASIQDARSHFRAKYGWPEKHEKSLYGGSQEHHDMRHKLFVVIDDDTMSAWNKAPEALTKLQSHEDYEVETEDEDSFIVKVVDVDYDEECKGKQFSASGRGMKKDNPLSNTFYGYMKTTPRYLQKVWTQLIIEFDFSTMFKRDKIYTG